MKPIRTALDLFIAALLLLTASAPHAQTPSPATTATVAPPAPGRTPDAARQWVHGSFINVRGGPAGNAPVLTHWTANTAVNVLGASGDWCRATAEDGVAGWVGCKLLGREPLTLAGLAAPDASGLPVSHAAQRAFWVAPSVGRFVAMGEAFNVQALTEEQRERERRTQKAIRFPIPEFDAAKERLARGVLPHIEQEQARVDIANWKPMGEIGTWRTDESALSQVRQLDPARHLPKAALSFFKRHGDVALLNESTPDVLISASGHAPRIDFRGKAEWVQGQHDEYVWSLWDVREVHVRLAKPLVQHVVARNGLVGATAIAERTAAATSPADGCQEGFTPLLAGTPLPGWPKPKAQDRLVALVLRDALARKSVEITSRKATANFRSDRHSPWQEPTQQQIVIHAIDLNADGVADLGVIEWLESGPISELPQSQRLEFVNIAGRWWFTGGESYGECT